MKQRGKGAPLVNKARKESAFLNYAETYSANINAKAIGQKLKDERKRLGFTQEQVAEVIGISPAFVGHIERAERSMSLDTLIHFCNLYRITMDYLLSDTLQLQQNNTLEQINSMLQSKTEAQQMAILDILRSVVRHI